MNLSNVRLSASGKKFIGNSVTYLSRFFVDRCQNLSGVYLPNDKHLLKPSVVLPGISFLKKTFHCSAAIKHNRKLLLFFLLSDPERPCDLDSPFEGFDRENSMLSEVFYVPWSDAL